MAGENDEKDNAKDNEEKVENKALLDEIRNPRKLRTVPDTEKNMQKKAIKNENLGMFAPIVQKEPGMTAKVDEKFIATLQTLFKNQEKVPTEKIMGDLIDYFKHNPDQIPQVDPDFSDLDILMRDMQRWQSHKVGGEANKNLQEKPVAATELSTPKKVDILNPPPPPISLRSQNPAQSRDPKADAEILQRRAAFRPEWEEDEPAEKKKENAPTTERVAPSEAISKLFGAQKATENKPLSEASTEAPVQAQQPIEPAPSTETPPLAPPLPLSAKKVAPPSPPPIKVVAPPPPPPIQVAPPPPVQVAPPPPPVQVAPPSPVKVAATSTESAQEITPIAKEPASQSNIRNAPLLQAHRAPSAEPQNVKTTQPNLQPDKAPAQQNIANPFKNFNVADKYQALSSEHRKGFLRGLFYKRNSAREAQVTQLQTAVNSASQQANPEEAKKLILDIIKELKSKDSSLSQKSSDLGKVIKELENKAENFAPEIKPYHGAKL